MARSAVTARAVPVELLAAQLRGVMVPLVRALRRPNLDGVTASQLSAVSTIDRHGVMTLGELAESEHVSAPMVTKIVVALEQRGLVSRSYVAADRRVCRVELSAGGRRWLTQARSRSNAWLAERLSLLTDDERAELASVVPLLERLVAADR